MNIITWGITLLHMVIQQYDHHLSLSQKVVEYNRYIVSKIHMTTSVSFLIRSGKVHTLKGQ